MKTYNQALDCLSKQLDIVYDSRGEMYPTIVCDKCDTIMYCEAMRRATYDYHKTCRSVVKSVESELYLKQGDDKILRIIDPIEEASLGNIGYVHK